MVTPLILVVIFSDMADNFEDMKVLKILVTRISSESPHRIQNMGTAKEI